MSTILDGHDSDHVNLCSLPLRATPSRGAQGGKKKVGSFLGPGGVLMALGGPWDEFSHPEYTKRSHGDPFGDILILV